MIDFLTEYRWLILLGISIAIDISILVLSFRKGRLNKEDYIEVLLDRSLPGFINLAEATGEDAANKLNLVVSLALRKIATFITKDKESFYRSLIISKVESILTTPQKKEKN